MAGRLHDILALISGFYAVASALFLVAAALGGTPMLPEVYGAATQYPAEAWAGYLVATHGLAALGLWSGRCIVGGIGAVLALPCYIALAVLAAPAQYSDIIVCFATLVHGPTQIVIATAAFRGAREGAM